MQNKTTSDNLAEVDINIVAKQSEKNDFLIEAHNRVEVYDCFLKEKYKNKTFVYDWVKAHEKLDGDNTVFFINKPIYKIYTFSDFMENKKENIDKNISFRYKKIFSEKPPLNYISEEDQLIFSGFPGRNNDKFPIETIKTTRKFLSLRRAPWMPHFGVFSPKIRGALHRLYLRGENSYPLGDKYMIGSRREKFEKMESVLSDLSSTSKQYDKLKLKTEDDKPVIKLCWESNQMDSEPFPIIIMVKKEGENMRMDVKICASNNSKSEDYLFLILDLIMGVTKKITSIIMENRFNYSSCSKTKLNKEFIGELRKNGFEGIYRNDDCILASSIIPIVSFSSFENIDKNKLEFLYLGEEEIKKIMICEATRLHEHLKDLFKRVFAVMYNNLLKK